MEFFLNHTGHPIHYKERGLIVTLLPIEPTLKLIDNPPIEHDDVSGLKVHFATTFKMSGTFEPGKNLIVSSDVANQFWRSLKQRGALGVYSITAYQMVKQDNGVTVPVATTLVRWDNE